MVYLPTFSYLFMVNAGIKIIPYMDPMGSASTHSQRLQLHANNPNNALVCFGQSLNVVLLHTSALFILLIIDEKENPSKLQYICIQFDATLCQFIYLVVEPTHLIHISQIES